MASGPLVPKVESPDAPASTAISSKPSCCWSRAGSRRPRPPSRSASDDPPSTANSPYAATPQPTLEVLSVQSCRNPHATPGRSRAGSGQRSEEINPVALRLPKGCDTRHRSVQNVARGAKPRHDDDISEPEPAFRTHLARRRPGPAVLTAPCSDPTASCGYCLRAGGRGATPCRRPGRSGDRRARRVPGRRRARARRAG